MNEPRKHLAALGLTDSEITIYLAMISGAVTARDLVKITRTKRPTVYYALGCLEKRGLISKTGLEGDKKFSVEPIEKLRVLADEKALEIAQLKNNIDELIPFLASQESHINKKPVVSFFEGQGAVKHAIMDMLYCKDKKLNSVVSKENFFWQVGKEFVELFVTERKRRGIQAKNLWDTIVDSKIMKQYYDNPSEVRIVPPSMSGKFDTTIFLYDDKTLYISSIHNSYCVLITSQEHHDTMQAWFDGLWEVAKLHKR